MTCSLQTHLPPQRIDAKPQGTSFNLLTSKPAKLPLGIPMSQPAKLPLGIPMSRPSFLFSLLALTFFCYFKLCLGLDFYVSRTDFILFFWNDGCLLSTYHRHLQVHIGTQVRMLRLYTVIRTRRLPSQRSPRTLNPPWLENSQPH